MATPRNEIAASVRTTGPGRNLIIGRTPPFMLDALCREVDPELFFPEKGQPSRPAKAVCAQCAVTTECLEYALAYESGAMGTSTSYAEAGIYGGLSPRERRKLRHARTSEEPAA